MVLVPAKRTRLYSEIVDQIVRLIHEGAIQEGDKLPGEQELCRTFQVSRGPLREALKVLEAMGAVEIIPGKGGVRKETRLSIGSRNAMDSGRKSYISGCTVRLFIEPIYADLWQRTTMMRLSVY